MTQPSIHVTVFANKSGTLINTARSMPLEEIERVIRTTLAAADKTGLPLLKLASFGLIRSEKGCLRHDANVETVHGVEGDYDGEVVPMAQAAETLSKHGVAAVLYTSASHTEGKPRWRVLVPLSRPLDGDTAQLYTKRRHWTGILNTLLGGVLTAESFVLSQCFFFGAITGKPEPDIIRLSGRCLDELNFEEIPKPIFPALNSASVETDTPYDSTTDADLVAVIGCKEAVAQRVGLSRYEAMLKVSSRRASLGMGVDDIEAVLLESLGDSPQRFKSNGQDPRQAARGIAETAFLKFGESRRHRTTRGTLHQTDSDQTSRPDRVALISDIGTLKFPTLQSISTTVLEPKTPVLKDLLFPGAWLGVGRPKVGKSWLFLQMALAVAEYDSFLGYPAMIQNAEVLAIFAEDDDARIQSRLTQLGVSRPPDRCHVVNQKNFQELAATYAGTMTFVEFLRLWLTNHPMVKLIIVDTEISTRQIWGGEAATADRRVVETDYKQTHAFDVLALDLKLVIILVNHAGKRKGEVIDLHETINRSNTALAGASGSIVLADPPDTDPMDTSSRLRVLAVRGRDLRDDLLLAVHQDEDFPRWVVDGPYTEVRQTNAENEILMALEDLMGDEECGAYVAAEDLAGSTGKSRDNVKRIISRMLKNGRKIWKQYRVLSKRGRNGGLRLERLSEPL